MKKSTKIIRLSVTLLLLIAMLLTPMSPVFAVVIENGDADLTAADIVSEDASKREKFSRHYLTGDGTYFAVSYAEQVNYQDEDGNWIAVDNSLSTNVLTGEKTTKNDKFKVKFANKANDDDLVTIKTKEYDVSFGITVSEDGESYLELNKVKGTESASNTSAEPKTTREATSLGKAVSGITYVDAFSDYLDVRYSVAHEKVKEDLILERKSGFNSYKVTYNIKEKDALATLNDDGSITFTNPDGAVLFNVGVPVMYDSDGKSSADIAVSMTQDKKTVEVTYTPSAEWLNAEERVYPVTIDPTVQTETTSDNYYETVVSHSSTPYEILPSTTNGLMQVFPDQSIFIRMLNVPTIPMGVSVSGVDFVTYFSNYTAYSDNDYFILNRVTTDWIPGNIFSSDGSLPTIDSTDFAYCTDEYITSHYEYYQMNFPIYSVYEQGYSNYFSTYNGFKISTTMNCSATMFAGCYQDSSRRPALIVRYSTSNSPNIVSGNLYHIVSNTGKYLTVNLNEDNEISENAQLTLTTKDLNADNQIFKINFNTSLGTYRIRPYATSTTETNSKFLKSNYDVSEPFFPHSAFVASGSYSWTIIPRGNDFGIYDANNFNVSLYESGNNAIISYYSDTDTSQNWSFELVEGQYDATQNVAVTLEQGDSIYISANTNSFNWEREGDSAEQNEFGKITAYHPGTTIITTSNGTTITITVLIKEGVYRFRNAYYDKFIRLNNVTSKLELYNFDASEPELFNWIVTRTQDNQFTIKSADTGEVVSFVDGIGSDDERALKCETDSQLSTQRWFVRSCTEMTINTTNNTTETYEIKPASSIGETTDWVMGAGDTIGNNNGTNVEYREYSENIKEKATWILEEVDPVDTNNIYSIKTGDKALTYSEMNVGSDLSLNIFTQTCNQLWRFEKADAYYRILVMNTDSEILGENSMLTYYGIVADTETNRNSDDCLWYLQKEVDGITISPKSDTNVYLNGGDDVVWGTYDSSDSLWSINEFEYDQYWGGSYSSINQTLKCAVDRNLHWNNNAITDQMISAAINAWNSCGANISLELVDNIGEAQIIIQMDDIANAPAGQAIPYFQHPTTSELISLDSYVSEFSEEEQNAAVEYGRNGTWVKNVITIFPNSTEIVNGTETVFKNLSYEQRYGTLLHELGHALKLKHPENEIQKLYPSLMQESGTASSTISPTNHITKFDEIALRNKWRILQ